jgi:hypothetical protein
VGGEKKQRKLPHRPHDSNDQPTGARLDRDTSPPVNQLSTPRTTGPEGDVSERSHVAPNSSTVLAGQQKFRRVSPVERALSLRWLLHFGTMHRGKCYDFERREFMNSEHGGGSPDGIVVTPEMLAAHRSARRSAERTGTGKPVVVRYVGIPFEEMTTADVMEAAIRPVCRAQHKSYAEAVVISDAAGSIGEPTYFVSHAWDNLFVELLDSIGAFLEGAAKDETFVWLDIFTINQDVRPLMFGNCLLEFASTFSLMLWL